MAEIVNVLFGFFRSGLEHFEATFVGEATPGVHALWRLWGRAAGFSSGQQNRHFRSEK